MACKRDAYCAIKASSERTMESATPLARSQKKGFGWKCGQLCQWRTSEAAGLNIVPWTETSFTNRIMTTAETFRLRTPLDKSAELIFHNHRLSLLHDEPPSTDENASLQVLKLFFAGLEAHLDDCINYGECHTPNALKHPRLERWATQELVLFARRK